MLPYAKMLAGGSLMAKSQFRDERGRLKFRVIDFELDSSDGSLQDALRILGTALAGPSAKGAPRTIDAKAAVPLQALTDGTDAEGQQPDGSAQEEAPVQRRPRGSGKPRVSATPQIVDNLDFDSGAVPLKAFFAQKSTGDADTRRYLVIAHWLKTQRGIESIDMNHVYTAYRHMGWNVPADAAKPFRNAKTQGWFGAGKERGEFSINHIGEGVVNKMSS
jgi:hypothetical protein